MTLTSSGMPIGRSISGRNMPLLPTCKGGRGADVVVSSGGEQRCDAQGRPCGSSDGEGPVVARGRTGHFSGPPPSSSSRGEGYLLPIGGTAVVRGAGHAIAITHLHPLLELLAVAEDLHAGFSVRVVRGLEAQCGQAQAREELVEHADEVAQSEAAVADEA